MTALMVGPRAPSGEAGAAATVICLDEATRGDLGVRFHDGPIQDLLAARYLADLSLTAAAAGADAATLAARLEEIRAAVAAGLSGSRAILGELTARSTDGAHLTGALRTAVPGTLHTGDDDDAELPTVTPAVAISAHRLARALARTAPEATVSVRATGDALVLRATPDPALDAEVDGWLLRAELLGATVSRTADRLTVTYPLAPAPEGIR